MNASFDNEHAFALAVQKHEIERLMALAVPAHQSGHLEEAAEIYQRILSINGLHPAALNNFSLMLDAKTALGMLKTALEIAPDYLDALVNASARSLELGGLSEAQAYFNRSREIAPDDVRVNALASSIENLRLSLTVDRPDNYDAKRLDAPLFSVIIPTHKRAPLLTRALASIAQQTSASQYEVIVISDCQDDATDQVCRKWLRTCDTFVRRSGKPGPSESRNIGLQLAKGEIVMFLDDDDAWHPGLLSALEKTAVLRQGQPVYFNCTVVKESRNSNGVRKHSEEYLDTKGLLTDETYVKNQIHMSCFAIPHALLRDLKFDPHMRAYEDWDFLLFLFDRKMPTHVDILGSQIHEVDDETTDRRGSSQAATDGNAIMDYIYVYRRHPVSHAMRLQRAGLLARAGINFPNELL